MAFEAKRLAAIREITRRWGKALHTFDGLGTRLRLKAYAYITHGSRLLVGNRLRRFL